VKRVKLWTALTAGAAVLVAGASALWLAACTSESYHVAPRRTQQTQQDSGQQYGAGAPLSPVAASQNSLGTVEGTDASRLAGQFTFDRLPPTEAEAKRVALLGDIPLLGLPYQRRDIEQRNADLDGNVMFDSRWAEGGGRGLGSEGLDGRTELLIIERSRERTWAANNALGCGGMVATWKDHEVTVPLKHTDVKAAVSGYISTVNVTQKFENPYDSKIEAVYVFPLPENAAVSEFLMTIGDRTIRGIIREREQAEQIYAAAKSQGYVASLMTEERPNIFTQKVANIEPGKGIDINIRYYSTLTYSDGGYEFFFPMVIGPRFNPPGTTEGVGAVAKGAEGASGQKTEVQYLRPDQRSGHDISLAVDVDAGVSIEKIACRDHAVEVQRVSPSKARVRLSDKDNIPNRDFVLRYDVAGDYVKSAMLTHEDSRGGFFTMMIVPPKDLAKVARGPVEMVFVLDCSGSMSGQPIAQAKAAIERGLVRLQPGDSFQIIDFAETATELGVRPLEATPENIRRGLAFLRPLDANGGTYMINGLRASLDFPHDAERLRFVAFCTDGYIGNEAEILGEEHQRLGHSRVFSFGVGSCNRYLLDSMARMGSGVAAYPGLNDDAGAIMDSFFDRISHPALCELNMDWGGAQVSEVYPSRLPDLFVGRPVIVTGRFVGRMPETVRVSGRVGRQTKTIEVAVNKAGGQDVNAALPQVWARTKLAELGDRATWDPDVGHDLAGTTRGTSLEYGLLSPYTAFIAVDSLTRTAGTYGTTVQVPVPEGVKYDTTVQPGREAVRR
jgi:Ca-activated chloride channel family protein